MANGIAAEQALQDTRSLPSLGIGVHLNIVRGRPLSNPTDIPSLVDHEGRFFNSVGTLLLKSFLGMLNERDIYTEYCSQVQRMVEAGIMPTHLDGEKHTHLLIPGCRRAVRRVCDRFNVRKVRTISERKLHALLAGTGVKMNSRISQSLKLVCLEHASLQALDCWQDMDTTDFFFGVLFSGRLTSTEALSALRALLSLDISMTVEWMFHLAYPVDLNKDLSGEFGTYFLNGERMKETEFIMSTEAREEIARHRENLISYREL